MNASINIKTKKVKRGNKHLAFLFLHYNSYRPTPFFLAKMIFQFSFNLFRYKYTARWARGDLRPVFHAYSLLLRFHTRGGRIDSLLDPLPFFFFFHWQVADALVPRVLTLTADMSLPDAMRAFRLTRNEFAIVIDQSGLGAQTLLAEVSTVNCPLQQYSAYRVLQRCVGRCLCGCPTIVEGGGGGGRQIIIPGFGKVSSKFCTLPRFELWPHPLSPPPSPPSSSTSENGTQSIFGQGPHSVRPR